MKKITTTLALLGALTMGLAEDSIDTQIEAIQTAPAQERVRLMNEFKKHLATMNSEERTQAIEKLQTKTRTQMQVKTQTRTRTQEMQMQNSAEMTRSQNMNQNQMANQYMRSNSQGSNTNQKMMGR